MTIATTTISDSKMKDKHTTTTESTHTSDGGNDLDVVLGAASSPNLPATVGGVTIGIVALLILAVLVMIVIVKWMRNRKLIILASHNGMASTNEYPLAGSNPIYKGEVFTQTYQ